MATSREGLPQIDEHCVPVEAAAPVVWDAILHVADQSFAPHALVARALGCRDTGATGPRPLAVGSALPGSHVTAADAPRELELVGSHRFAGYVLVFRIDEPEPGQVRLCAETRAAFPGRRGTIYRALVIGTGGHVLVVNRMLTVAKRRAERTQS